MNEVTQHKSLYEYTTSSVRWVGGVSIRLEYGQLQGKAPKRGSEERKTRFERATICLEGRWADRRTFETRNHCPCRSRNHWLIEQGQYSKNVDFRKRL